LPPISLATPLQFLKGVGPRRAADLQRAGLVTAEDLLFRFPIRYEDRGRVSSVAGLKPGQTVSLAVEILSTNLRSTRRAGFKIFEALLRDRTGHIRAVWLNQPFLKDVIRPHERVFLYGPVEMKGSGALQLTNPQYELIDTDEGEAIHTGRIVPVYERTGALTPKMQRRLVHDVLELLPEEIVDPLPETVRRAVDLPGRRRALADVHFPPAGTPVDRLNDFRTPAQQRLIFEEFFLFQVGIALRRRVADAERKPHTIAVDDRIRSSARSVLPFRLTAGQREAVREIAADLQRPYAMNRLLQGDVGAGKTIVALLAALIVMENGLQVAFMAPTEILAEQHFRSIGRLLERSRFRVRLLTGSVPPAARREALAELHNGATHLAVGTHALVQEDVRFRQLGLAIIDEQHRFGVLQRATLRAKGLHPDVLVMTATPIPRTLALTTYGDLDVSVLRDQPPGRTPIKTVVKPESRHDEIFAFVTQEIAGGRQAYIVYPLVEESEKVDLKAATAMAEHLSRDVFPQHRVALLHGRLSADVKEGTMRAFVSGDIDVLVSTTVIEVGVDVANATVMIVEHAERFGLSQLHQLRGRVGRGPHQSYCILMYQPPLSDQARGRLQAMAETTDGFVIAERDLQLRGPGDFFGTRQSGLPTLRIGDLVRDYSLMELAREHAVREVREAGADSPLITYVRSTWEQRFGLIGVG
jgi:ATP-dependent DNA helicase RecG